MNLPVADLHCDLLSYLKYVEGANVMSSEIGCSLPFLKQGNVALQVLAIFTATEKGSSEEAYRQSVSFNDLLLKHRDKVRHIKNTHELENTTGKIGVIAAIENASGICEEDGSLEEGLQNLEEIINNVHRILYISFTHSLENRFGGGNATTVGIKDDGKVLLNYLHGRQIAVDLSHTSDALAYDILDHIVKFGLEIPILASHSNYRTVFDHPRNLTDDIAKEIIKRKGLIGLNFLRAFLHPNNAEVLYDHIQYGLQLGGSTAVCFGADYFFSSHPDPTRLPYYFPEHEDASKYQSIIRQLSQRITHQQVEAISHKNIIDFIGRTWK